MASVAQVDDSGTAATLMSSRPKKSPSFRSNLLEIEALPHQFNDKPRDMAFRHEVLHIRRQKQCLIDIPGAKILAHSPRLNQTRPALNSDYSDRLLARHPLLCRFG